MCRRVLLHEHIHTFLSSMLEWYIQTLCRQLHWLLNYITWGGLKVCDPYKYMYICPLMKYMYQYMYNNLLVHWSDAQLFPKILWLQVPPENFNMNSTCRTCTCTCTCMFLYQWTISLKSQSKMLHVLYMYIKFTICYSITCMYKHKYFCLEIFWSAQVQHLWLFSTSKALFL